MTTPGKKQEFGYFIVSDSMIVAEVFLQSDINFLVMDMEASTADRRSLVHFCQMMTGREAKSFARVADAKKTSIEEALDVGVDGVIVPKVNNGAEAADVVSAAYYPPTGTRGLNPIRCSNYFNDLPEYFTASAEKHVIGVQIETREGLENVDVIAATAGIDLLFIGVGDLAAELGCIGDTNSPVVWDAIESIAHACKKHGKIAGAFCYDAAAAKRMVDMGFDFLSLSNDIKLLKSALAESDELITGFRK